jgi:hypothetical protein
MDLPVKIRELLDAGTRQVWVVRLTGPRRVEVHQPDQRVRLVHPGEQLEAPGILANPVPVEALYDREAARQVILRNLLQRQGYAGLDEVRAEGEARGEAKGELQGLRDAIVEVLTARGLAVDDSVRTALASAGDAAALKPVLRLAALAASTAEVVAGLRPRA